MKHAAISTESQEAFKESILDVIDYTPAMLADELKNLLNQCGIDEGVRGSIWVFSGTENGHPVAWCKYDVSATALEEWVKRTNLLLDFVRKQKWFHVEHKQTEKWARAATEFEIKLKYERS